MDRSISCLMSPETRRAFGKNRCHFRVFPNRTLQSALLLSQIYVCLYLCRQTSSIFNIFIQCISGAFVLVPTSLNKLAFGDCCLSFYLCCACFVYFKMYNCFKNASIETTGICVEVEHVKTSSVSCVLWLLRGMPLVCFVRFTSRCTRHFVGFSWNCHL